MYDTLNIACAPYYLDTDYQNRIPKLLQGVQQRYSYVTNFYTTWGYLENYKVIVNENGLFLNGSIAKFYNGVKTHDFVKFRDYNRGIDKLSDCLHVDVNKGVIKRLDFGQNIETENQASAYLALFLEMPYMKRTEHQFEQVLFYNKNREFAIYDKAAELINKKVEYKGNLLRLEARILKRVKDYFNGEAISPAMLCNPKIHKQLCQFWLTQYSSITKTGNNVNKSINVTTSPKDLKNQLAAFSLTMLDTQRLLEHIETAYKQGGIDRSTAYRLKDTIKELLEAYKSPNDALLNELNYKVKRAYNTALNELN